MTGGKFIIFHDFLLQSWRPEAQKHITARGYEHQQMRIFPPTYAKVHMRCL